LYRQDAEAFVGSDRLEVIYLTRSAVIPGHPLIVLHSIGT
jgi:hypothetical protein